LIFGFKNLAVALNVPVRTLRTLKATGVLPYIRAGHRTIFFRASAVERALARRTFKEVK
jgi:hypothetical protein